MATDNPFIEVYDKLWELLESVADFTSLVKVGNRIKLSASKSDPFKDAVQDSDFPEVQILPGGGKSNLFATSSTHFVDQVYFLRSVTGELNAITIFGLKWAMIKALAKTEDNLGLDYIQNITISDAQDNIEVGEENRGRLGWRGMIAINVEMKFSKDSIQEI